VTGLTFAVSLAVDDRPRRRIDVTGRAERDLRQLTTRDQERVRQAIDGLQARPPMGDIRKLQGTDEWRLRVGDLRVRFELVDAGQVVCILRVCVSGCPTGYCVKYPEV
jgi:mRNA-degrading endonuclease RelE of RelBE toxin-antitoxin system